MQTVEKTERGRGLGRGGARQVRGGGGRGECSTMCRSGSDKQSIGRHCVRGVKASGEDCRRVS